MSFLTAPPRTEYRVVYSGFGAATLSDGTHIAKARLWILEDRRVILLQNDPTDGRATIAGDWTAVKATVSGPSVSIEFAGFTMLFELASCGCGGGAIVGSGPDPSDPRWSVTFVRKPDWIVES